ncbi:MAG: hypothetical protein KDF60_16100 [Calditrichaeota bacterium]|nr:hypothetical protein [Calditrichota bacterium]
MTTIMINGIKLLLILLLITALNGQSLIKNKNVSLNIPDRQTSALSGSQFAKQVTGLNLSEREDAVIHEIMSGNIPSFSRTFKPCSIKATIDKKDYELIINVSCDYLAIGSDKDYLYIPLTSYTAQIVADTLNCILPSKLLVDSIYAQAEIKLHPQPIPPSEKMTTVPVFLQHMDSAMQQIGSRNINRNDRKIIAGHKKDIIISNKIYNIEKKYNRVVIYGWHKALNDPIQPVYNGHNSSWADYSHGVRLISKHAFLNRQPISLEEIYKDPILSILISNEGPILKPHYPKTDHPYLPDSN